MGKWTWVLSLTSSSFHYFSGSTVQLPRTQFVRPGSRHAQPWKHEPRDAGWGRASLPKLTVQILNLFAQIVGRRLLLVAVEEWKLLNMHPSYHGSRRQSQISHSLHSHPTTTFRKGNGRDGSVPGAQSQITCRESTDAHSPTWRDGIFLNPSDVLLCHRFGFILGQLIADDNSYSVLSPSREEYHFMDALYVGAVRRSKQRSAMLRIAVVHINRILKK